MKRMQASYAAGELAPSLHSRTDLAKWQIGLAEANNLLVHIHGGISNRPGTRYVGTALGPNRLLPFEYSVDDTYVMEFSDYKVRFIRDGALVLHQATRAIAEAVILDGSSDVISVGAIYGDRTISPVAQTVHLQDFTVGATETAVLNSTIGFAVYAQTGQIYCWYWDDSAGALAYHLMSGLAALTTGDHTIFAEWDGDIFTVTVDGTDTDTFDLSTTGDANDTPEYEQEDWELMAVWATLDSVKISQFDYQFNGVDVLSLTPVIDGTMYDSVGAQYFYNRYQTTNKFPFDIVAGTEANPDAGSPVEITTPFAYADLDEVRFVQREDVMYFTHQSYGEYELIRYSHYQWWFNPAEYVPNISAPEMVDGIPKNFLGARIDIEYRVAAISADGEESLPSVAATVSGAPSTQWTAGAYITLTWEAVSGADLYVVYKNSRGYDGYIGSTTGLSFVDDNIAPDSADGPKVARDPFSGAGNYPGAIGIYQQRKVYGRTKNLPQTTWLTQSGTMDNLAVSRPLKDSDAITAQLDSNTVNEILHFVSMKDLVVITNNGVWSLSSGNNADALTPTANRYDLQSAYGGSKVPPIVSGNTILIVPNYRDGVREFFYQVQAGGLESTPLDVMSNHLFATDKIKEWAYQRDESILWCVMESGCINALTYMREHEVVAWTTVETAGDFESVCVVRSENRDTPYFTVKRNVNGSDVRYIEELTERLPGGVLEDSVFMDCSRSYDGAADTLFSNLDHLEGETVVALADGNVVEDLVVSSGSVTLPVAASKVHIGLPYQVDFETLDVDYETQDGTGFGDVKVINKVTLFLENTRGLQVGPTSSELTEMKDRTDEGYDEATRMFTGKKDIQIKPHWNSNGRVHVRQSYPLPMTILAHIPEVQPGDD